MKFKMESNYTELQKVVYKKVGDRTYSGIQKVV